MNEEIFLFKKHVFYFPTRMQYFWLIFFLKKKKKVGWERVRTQNEGNDLREPFLFLEAGEIGR